MTLPTEIESVASELVDRFAKRPHEERAIRDSIEAAYARGIADGTILATRQTTNFIQPHIREQIKAAVRELMKDKS